MKIGLLRHGITDWNSAGLLQGQTDRPLGPGEAERLGELSLPPEWANAALLSSPLVRARDTARIVSGKKPPTDERLIEMNFGDWEGLAGKDLRADPQSGFRDVEYWGWDFRPPNGETPQEVWNRVSMALDSLTETTLIVCHMVVIRVVLAKAHGWNFEGHPPFQIKRDRIYGVTVEDKKLTPDPAPIRLIMQ